MPAVTVTALDRGSLSAALHHSARRLSVVRTLAGRDRTADALARVALAVSPDAVGRAAHLPRCSSNANGLSGQNFTVAPDGFDWQGTTYASLSANRPRHHRHGLESEANRANGVRCEKSSNVF
jgi:hypothetical protein